jgi:hypothetical protein
MSYVYKCQVNKHTSKKKVKTIRVVADNLVQASHMAMEKIHNSGLFMNDCIELVSIKKDFKVKNVYSMDDVFEDGDGEGDESEPLDLNAPLDLSHANADNIIEFKCSCTNKIKVNMIDWNVLRCPHCQRIVLRRDISEVAGIFIYTPSNGSGK